MGQRLTPIDTRTAPSAPNTPQIRLYQDWLQTHRGLAFKTYNDFWRWSITDRCLITSLRRVMVCLCGAQRHRFEHGLLQGRFAIVVQYLAHCPRH